MRIQRSRPPSSEALRATHQLPAGKACVSGCPLASIAASLSPPDAANAALNRRFHCAVEPGSRLDAEILGALTDASLAARSLADQVRANWTDATLLESDGMYGETWQRGMTALILVLHQAHHRGQMTVLMRQAGLKVPGVYGPAMEDWAVFGMTAPAI